MNQVQKEIFELFVTIAVIVFAIAAYQFLTGLL
jgi:hypothetical protein